jgi:transcriptional regulator GlxA family with amidase domain
MSLFEVFNYNWTIPEKMHPRAYEYTKRLIEIFSENSPSACMEKQALLRFLLAPFITGVRSDVGRDEMIEHERFHDALTMIEERLEDPLTVEMLADSAHLHPNYFSNLFSERFGMSPLQYILKKRIERAQILLWSSSEPVKSISIKSGYDDPCYFSRIFKKHTGMTPLQYRKSLEVSS